MSETIDNVTANFLAVLSKEGSAYVGDAKDVIEVVHSLPAVHLEPAGVMLEECGMDADGEPFASRNFQTFEDHFHTVGVDKDTGAVTQLGSVGRRYEVIQDEDAFGYLDVLMRNGEITPLAAGSANKGAKHWVLSKYNGHDFNLGDGNSVRPYLLSENSHDGSCSKKSSIFNLVAACLNGQVFTQNETNQSIRHTKGAALKMAEAHKVLAMMSGGLSMLFDKYRSMMNTKITKEQQRDYILAVMGIDLTKGDPSTRSENMLADIGDIINKGRTAEAITDAPRTAWSAFNAITEYTNHKQTVRGGKGRLNSVWFGAGSKRMNNALELANAL